MPASKTCKITHIDGLPTTRSKGDEARNHEGAPCGVREEIIVDGRRIRLGVGEDRRDTQKQITRVGDTRIGEKPLDVLLTKRAEVPDEHRQEREATEKKRKAGRGLHQRGADIEYGKHANERREGRSLDHRRHETRHRDHRPLVGIDRKSTRLNSSHVRISYAVFCLKKKKKPKTSSAN